MEKMVSTISNNTPRGKEYIAPEIAVFEIEGNVMDNDMSVPGQKGSGDDDYAKANKFNRLLDNSDFDDED